MKVKIKHIKEIARKRSIQQLIKYGLVGISGLFIDIGFFYLLAKKWEIHYPFSNYLVSISNNKLSINVIDTDISHIISSTLAIINNFILNSYFTFKVTDKKFKRFLSFAGIAFVGLIISTTLITVLMEQFGWDQMTAKIISVIIVAMMQFLINKFFTFRQR